MTKNLWWRGNQDPRHTPVSQEREAPARVEEPVCRVPAGARILKPVEAPVDATRLEEARARVYANLEDAVLNGARMLKVEVVETRRYKGSKRPAPEPGRVQRGNRVEVRLPVKTIPQGIWLSEWRKPGTRMVDKPDLRLQRYPK